MISSRKKGQAGREGETTLREVGEDSAEEIGERTRAPEDGSATGQFLKKRDEGWHSFTVTSCRKTERWGEERGTRRERGLASRTTEILKALKESEGRQGGSESDA